jgi:hypothetical protein
VVEGGAGLGLAGLLDDVQDAASRDHPPGQCVLGPGRLATRTGQFRVGSLQLTKLDSLSSIAARCRGMNTR